MGAITAYEPVSLRGHVTSQVNIFSVLWEVTNVSREAAVLITGEEFYSLSSSAGLLLFQVTHKASGETKSAAFLITTNTHPVWDRNHTLHPTEG